jgi:F0F1-type ATP synthase assembly protein I
MTIENNDPDTQKQQDNSNTPDSAERQRIRRLADDLAKRAKERQLRYDDEHNIFTK